MAELLQRKTFYFSAQVSKKLQNDFHKEDIEVTPLHLDIIYRLRPAVRFFHVFGLFPCRLPPSTSANKSYWWRMQLTYTSIVVCSLTMFFVSQATEYHHKVAEEEPCTNAACVIRKLPGLIYSIVICFVSWYSFFAFREFSRILVRWNKVISSLDHCFRSLKVMVPDTTVNRYHVTRNTVIGFMLIYYVSAVIEHLLGNAYMAFNCLYYLGENCNILKYSWDEITHRNVSAYIHGLGYINIPFYIINKYAFVTWNMTDCTVMLLGICLTSNFKAFNSRLKEFNKKRRSEYEWKIVRKAHLRLCDLLISIDDVLSPAILTIMFVACFFVCQQVFSHLYVVAKMFASCFLCTPNASIRMAYGAASLLHLIFRIFGVCMISSMVRDEVKAPLNILSECHEEDANSEVQRFWDHVTDTEAGFTGMKLFIIDRDVLIKALGVLVTYEMIFLSIGKDK